ncbi:hypothetical protein vseg_006788 [Gypsophila vaccaria]
MLKLTTTTTRTSSRHILPTFLKYSKNYSGSIQAHFANTSCSIAGSIKAVAADVADAVVDDDSHFIIKPLTPPPPGAEKVEEWKKLSSRELGISTSSISGPTKAVLKQLKKNGYEVYLVGGCVRDLILKRVPKDFDILTSAELREVLRSFKHSEIVGKRFPICHVHIGDHVVEVSSFNSGLRRSNRKLPLKIEVPNGCNEKDTIRWRNCMQRDFTINGLMFDPFARVVYDYTSALADLKKSKVRTIIPASISFHEDCARILRAVRIAARLGFRLERETAQCIRNSSYSILRLDTGRFLLEMNYMLAYGSAEASLRLLWRFGLLEIILPHQAAYLVQSGFRRKDPGSNMLLALFANLDKHLAPDMPCHSSLWVTLLAFHKALADQARAPSVIAAFALAINNGGDIEEAVDVARMIYRPSEPKFHELLENQNCEKAVLTEEVQSLAVSVNVALSSMTDKYAISKAMAKYPQAPQSDLVFIPFGLYVKVSRILECVTKGREVGSKQGGKIDYDMLAVGRLQEVRHVFARVVFDTIYPLRFSDHRIAL